MSGVVLLTGATGFIGTHIARRLLTQTSQRVVALVRAGDQAAAARRLARAWWDWPDLAGALGTRIEALAGDVTLPRLGLGAAYDDLARQVTHIIHAAADMRLDAPIEQLRAVNVDGTAQVLELACAAHRDHGLSRLSHISTAYVCGKRSGPIPEDALTDEFGFSNDYERSKFEGERLVRQALPELPISIFRPGMVVGDSRTGAVKTFNTLYVPLRRYLTGKLRLIPARPELPINLIPVDYVADAVAGLTFDRRALGRTFHLVAPAGSLPTARELLTFTRQWAAQQHHLRLARPIFIPSSLAARWSTSVHRLARRAGASALASLLPYFSHAPRFQRDNLDRLLGPYQVDWRDLLPPLLDYALSRGFLHRSKRTVHEQILFRLGSTSRPVTYHDIVDSVVITRDSAEVRREILVAARAMRAMGVGPGDRVGIVGLNSTRYLALDVAIGLLGAVSVPLYYTSPPSELDTILRASGARLLLIGAPKLLARLDEGTTELPVVSFCREPLLEGLQRSVMSWDVFLATGASADLHHEAPVAPDDRATLRYTSGTTGPPKGVVFTHRQLRWLAETVASLWPWEVRVAPASYLSCLPLNHVVEGILGTYSPYYLPAPIDIYFLEDIHALPSALPTARPTIFFSVPRLYERLWERLETSQVGRSYVTRPAGVRKRLLRPLVCRQLLRRAGLDRCAQLIAGSAPISETLLRSFRELGIEIYNAYGLTEAPLVTINRLGANQLGTVGRPLPETRLALADDGEVLVSGPQVTAGYLEADAAQPVRDGWLLTGDLGYLMADGSLVIAGRKKELLATAYGKKVQATKVETRLRAIPGVVEAMLVGEGRPYCTALLWVENATGNTPAAHVIDRAVVEVNANLSHPEQVKRWVMLDHDLSVDRGDLTANLKLRRASVANRYRDVIEALYRDGPGPADAVHVGRVPREEAVAV
jgi:long-chain acyl-CoA synthetase